MLVHNILFVIFILAIFYIAEQFIYKLCDIDAELREIKYIFKENFKKDDCILSKRKDWRMTNLEVCLSTIIGVFMFLILIVEPKK